MKAMLLVPAALLALATDSGGCKGIKIRDPNTGEERDLLGGAKKNLDKNVSGVQREVDDRKAGLQAMSEALAGCPIDRRDAYDVDAAQEYVIGRAVAAKQLTKMDVDLLAPDDPTFLYVTKVGQALAIAAEQIGDANYPERDEDMKERSLTNRPYPYTGYHFLVAKSDEVNAFGAPGGVVMITTGMLGKLQSEDQLAAVLAHEIAHVQRGHGIELLKAWLCKRNASDKASAAAKDWATRVEANVKANLKGAGIKSTTDQKLLSELMGGMIEGAASVFEVGFPEGFEREADRIGMRVMISAGYDPQAYLALLAKLKSEQSPKLRYKSTHPPFDARIALLTPMAEKSPAKAVAPLARKVRFEQALAKK